MKYMFFVSNEKKIIISHDCLDFFVYICAIIHVRNKINLLII